MPYKRTRAMLLEAIEGRLEGAQKELDQFQERFAKNPHHALTWAPLEAAAMLGPLQTIAASCKAELEGDETEEQAYERIRAYIEYQAMSHADRVHRSTSATSNLLGDYERAQWVRLMQFANGQPLGRV